MRRTQYLAGLALLLAAPASAQGSAAQPAARVQQIIAGEPFRKAAAALDAGHDRWVADTIAITEIPAPPFKEQTRAKAFAQMLRGREYRIRALLT
jgi:hypothetical protein